MATIKTMIVEKIQQQRHGILQQEDLTDDEVRKELERYFHVICLTLPGENDPNNNPVGAEFANIMFSAENGEGNDLHEKAINKLISKVMDERDDLSDKKYKHLRQKIVEVIATTKNSHDLYDGISYKDLVKTADER